MAYQLSLKVERENIISSLFIDDELPTSTEDSKKITNRRSLPMAYQLSLKVEREYIISPPFTNDKLPTFTEGIKKNIPYHRRLLTMNYQCSLKIAKR